MPNAPDIPWAAVTSRRNRFDTMREVIIVERETTIENGRTVLRERRIRGLQYDDGAFRLLFYYGRRIASPRRERSDHAKSA